MNGPVKMARSCVRPTTVRLFSASTCRLRLAETCRVATWASAWRLTPITTAFFIWEHAAGMGCGAAPTTGRPGPRSAAFRTRAPIFQILPVHTPETRSAWCGSHSTLIRSAQAELRRQFMSASLTLGTVFIEARTVARPGAAVPGQPTGFLPHHGKLASNGMLYISYSNGAGPYDGSSGDVWKFDTSNGTWTRISPVPSTDTANDYFGYGGLSVDAQNPNVLVVAALNSWWPDTIFFRSLDGGSTWNRIWNWGPWPTIVPNYTLSYASVAPWLTFGDTPSPCTSSSNLNSLCPQPTPKLGWMVGSMEIDPFNSDRMLYGTGATVFGTSNLTAWDTGGQAQVSVNAIGVEETSVQDLISPPAGAHLISAVADVGGFTHSDLNGPTVMHTNPVFSTATSLDFAESIPSFIVRVGYGGANIAFSTDGGTSWSAASNPPSGASGGSVAAAADGSRVLWSSGAGVFFSTDHGTTWTASLGIPSGVRVCSDRVNSSKFFGFAKGTFYVSSDGGVSFVASAAALPSVGSAY